MTRCESKDGLVHEVFARQGGMLWTLCASSPWGLVGLHDERNPQTVYEALDVAPVTCLRCATGHVAP